MRRFECRGCPSGGNFVSVSYFEAKYVNEGVRSMEPLSTIGVFLLDVVGYCNT
jgi:hypothetical protein